MGGRPKGLLPHPSGSGTLVAHVVAVARAAGCEVVLLGAHADYASLGIPMLPDAHADVGPMGGMQSLLRAAQGRDAIAIACDMPYVPVELLQMLRAARREECDAVMPVRATGREPLCALYRSERVLPVVEQALGERRLALRALAARLVIEELRLAGDQQRWLDDWDEPQDMAGC